MKTTVEIVMNSRMDSGITNNSLAYRLLKVSLPEIQDKEIQTKWEGGKEL